MNERNSILSGREPQPVTALMPKSLVARMFGYFIEKFDAAVAFLSKWTNV